MKCIVLTKLAEQVEWCDGMFSHSLRVSSLLFLFAHLGHRIAQRRQKDITKQLEQVHA